MNIWLWWYADGGLLLDTEPCGDRNVMVELDERAAKAILHLLHLESFEIAYSLGQLAAAFAKEDVSRPDDSRSY